MLRARTLYTHLETRTQTQIQIFTDTNVCEHKEGYNNCKWKCAKVPSEKRLRETEGGVKGSV